MSDASSRTLADKLSSLAVQLRALNHDLRSSQQPDENALREFRQALDNVRLTAWTVSELLNARQIQRDPRAVVSFLTAERVRRFSQMVNDLCGDMDHEGSTWPSASIDSLRASVNVLQERLGMLAGRRDDVASYERKPD